jgi:hypothetical protein
MFVPFSHASCLNCCKNVPPKARNDISKRFSAEVDEMYIQTQCTQKEMIERFSPRSIKVRVALAFMLVSIT